MRRIRRTTALLTAAALAGCTATAPATGPSAAPTPAGASPVALPPPKWRDCTAGLRKAIGARAAKRTYQCGQVTVPQDWAAAGGGGTYKIAVVRIRAASQKNRIGSLIVNPGGPGGSGLELAVAQTLDGPGALPKAVTDRFDVVGFDPRGVGQSSPVRCTDDKALDAINAADPDPAQQADFDATVGLIRTAAQGCATKYGAKLVTLATEQAARDIDAIRAAVGDAKTTYLGYSYGTLLGATYAQLFPGRVRAMVLDGAVDPTADPVAAAEQDAVGFERAFDRFAAWCRGAGAGCPLGADARARAREALAAARTTPVAGPGGRRATAGWVATGILGALYSRDRWPVLAKALTDLRRGKAAGILAIADTYAQRDPKGHYSNTSDAHAAIDCADQSARPPLAQVRQLQLAWRQRYPLFGAMAATGLIGCTVWPGGSDPYPAGPATGAPTVVVIGTTGDPATQYEDTAKLAGMLGVGRVVTFDGDGHTAYPNGACLDTAVDRYLVDLVVPAEGTRCAAR